jgi:hypothetical protein
MKSLVGYIWGANNLTYLYGDGSNETFYRTTSHFNGVPDVPFWIYCLCAIVVVAIVVGCLCTAKRQKKMTKKRSLVVAN